MLRILWSLIIAVMVLTAPVDVMAFAGLAKYIPEIIKKFSKSAPKQADELPPTGNKGLTNPDELPTTSSKSLNKADEWLALDKPLITRTLARALHNKKCPTIRLRVSLPQLNVIITVPSALNVRSGPGTNHRKKGQFTSGGVYLLDLLSSTECWIRIRYAVEGGEYDTGWTSAKHLKFEYDNHLTKPEKRLTRTLDTDEVYELVAGSTYKIQTPRATGSAVAISPTALLTNCHVLGQYDVVQIVEGSDLFPAILIHDDKSKDKCFIRSLTLEVRPVPNVQNYSNIRKGIKAYTIGAPLGHNRSIGEGAVFNGHQLNGVRWIDATAQVEPGSSGGGLFDTKGNLLGITTLKITTHSGLKYSSSIAAEDFWR
jgi:S1-C subfamily serine protease